MVGSVISSPCSTTHPTADSSSWKQPAALWISIKSAAIHFIIKANTDPVNRDGKLHVNFSDRLVTLLREVRQLNGMGYDIPAKIQTAHDVSKKFYRYGVVLKQVAHFYNNIDEQIIESQVGQDKRFKYCLTLM